MTKALILAAMLCLAASRGFAAEIRESAESFGPFGQLHVYSPATRPTHLTLVVSGDGGWNRSMGDMAKSLAETGSIVAGIDLPRYVRQIDAGHGRCVYSAAQFEDLSHFLQKKYDFSRYALPALVGYSSGAALVYGTLAQSPPNTFAGGVVIDFCPDLITAKPLCKGAGLLQGRPGPRGGFTYGPVPTLAAPLRVLPDGTDRSCTMRDAATFLGKVKNAEIVRLAERRNLTAELKQALQAIEVSPPPEAGSVAADDELADLPLVVLPVRDGKALAVIVSGDGGWAGIDRQVAHALNKDGIPVVGLDSLQYFWEKKNPDIAGKDLARILNHYGRVWGADKFILVGYSFGADTLPFMASRLPADLRAKIGAVALLGPGLEADFEFHVAEWVFNIDGTHKVVPEVQKLKGMNVLCMYGQDEEATSACPSLNKNEFEVVELQGGHHFGGDYESLARIILEHAK